MDYLAVNAKLGDGCLVQQKEGHGVAAQYNGKNFQWINFKRETALHREYQCSEMKAAFSGYKNDFSLVQFRINVDPRMTRVYCMPIIDVLSNLRKLDLIMWYIDDGSWHKRAKTMHLYCNALTEYEVKVLQERIYKLYHAEARLKWDKKKDGRRYPYLYFTRPLTNKFWKDVRRFIRLCNLDTLTYKVGETPTTIRNGVAYERRRSGEMPLTGI